MSTALCSVYLPQYRVRGRRRTLQRGLEWHSHPNAAPEWGQPAQVKVRSRDTLHQTWCHPHWVQQFHLSLSVRVQITHGGRCSDYAG